jgi:predicted nuclease with TOPRIM domain
MDKVKGFLKNKYVIGFGAGLAAAFIGYRAYKSEKIRKAVVKAVAYGMKLREDAKFAMNTIKEDAEDLCAEAKEKNSGSSGVLR